MPKIPQRKTLSERDVQRLTQLYIKAQEDMLATFGNATDFGQARRTELIGQIDAILRELGVRTGDFLGEQLTKQYKRGAADAIRQLKSIQVDIRRSTTFAAIDKQAVGLLVSETQEAFAQSLTNAKKSTVRAVNTAARESIQIEMATGTALGETRINKSARIKAILKEQGIGKLYDASGRQWTLDRYAEMLARTKMVEARNYGLANKMVQNGYDLVEVSFTGTDHDACRRWQGKILSLTGRTKGYPTLDDAKADGLFHPNCEHQINVVHLSAKAITKAYNPQTGKYAVDGS